MFKYKHAILGGTFDRLHAGHKHFIETAENISEKVTIGLVTDKFLGNRLHKDIIEPYKVRERELKEYLISKSYDAKTIIYPLSDIFGPSLKDPDIDMVLAIDESIENAQLINRERAKKGFSKLSIVVVPKLKADDNGPISSKRMRSGEIDRKGNAYLNLFQNSLKLPEDLRSDLRKPFGKIIEVAEDYEKIPAFGNLIIGIGDIVVANFIKVNKKPNLSIVDFKTQRRPIIDKDILKLLPRPDIKAKNLHSTIDRDAVLMLNSLMSKSISSGRKYVIEIEGEEDLLAIPAILLSPLGSIVLYGIRNVGGVIVTVTERKKEEVKGIVAKFDILKQK